ncbi:hypothetical protein RSOLAG1IB_01941 [Rhizoctonia solani AG-1 IB]|uniref:Zn(2)-C6 fungal-type domain-containing protein n=1 Tax=Thanatephorus cucumeris (strain AG1-IB / isolate 7/3/14) TaxID=1108050 RepID=A0A0B7FI68_THACB|nr:hypothetical protein RSOLAG1IB_01941 [Rhizoctonia solani AG-1 IB]
MTPCHQGPETSELPGIFDRKKPHLLKYVAPSTARWSPMDEYAKRVSGPRPLSCITCRQRRKKCDRTRPTCERCRAGGFTCLGYASRNTGPASVTPGSTLQDQATQVLRSSTSPYSGRSDPSIPTQHCIRTSQSPKLASDTHDAGDMPPQIEPHIILPLPLLASPTVTPLADGFSNSELLADWMILDSFAPYTYTVPTEEAQINESSTEGLIDSCELAASLNLPSHGSTWPSHSNNASALKQAEGTDQALTVYMDPDTSAATVEYIFSQYQRAFKLMSFELTTRQQFVANGVFVGMTMSKGACWSLFIGAKIYEAAMSDYHVLKKQYIKTLDKFEQQIMLTKRNGMSMRESSGLLFAVLEASQLLFLA